MSDFLSYSTAIYNRALPDVVDGLKSAQRRAILGLHDLKLTSISPYCKVSRLEGHVLGRYHPQGGCAGTIINMGQHSNMRYVLTDIHGNAGGSIQTGTHVGQLISEDSPAAARYLEVRSTDFCEKVYTSQLRKGIGDWKPNYDGTTSELHRFVPSIPALLLTGSTGIASGYACNFISYNLKDVISETCAVIKNKNLSEKQFIAKFTHPPESPQGGRVVKSEGIEEIISTGRGSYTVYGNWELDDKLKWKKRSTKPAIIITRLASSSSEKFVERVRDLAEAEKLPGLIDVSDQSNRDGIRVVLVTKTPEDREKILRYLSENTTQLKYTHNVNCVAVSTNGTPKTVGAKEIIESWYVERVKYLTEVYSGEVKSLIGDRDKLEAVLKVLSDVDKFLKIIRTTKTKDEVVGKIMRSWKLSEELARHVISIPISTLINTERDKVQSELESLAEKINLLSPLCKAGTPLDNHICEQVTGMKSLLTPPRSEWFSAIMNTSTQPPNAKPDQSKPVKRSVKVGGKRSQPASKRQLPKAANGKKQSASTRVKSASNAQTRSVRRSSRSVSPKS